MKREIHKTIYYKENIETLFEEMITKINQCLKTVGSDVTINYENTPDNKNEIRIFKNNKFCGFRMEIQY
jgi:formylmethanofuran:tetrahydromethanopterin formyltransferase